MSSSGAGSSNFTGSTSLNITISEKLTRAQVLHEICGAQLDGYLDGSIAAPMKEMMVKDKDAWSQQSVTLTMQDGFRKISLS
jgi:hypothetical protein